MEDQDQEKTFAIEEPRKMLQDGGRGRMWVFPGGPTV
jgi:hypothetical protein